MESLTGQRLLPVQSPDARLTEISFALCCFSFCQAWTKQSELPALNAGKPEIGGDTVQSRKSSLANYFFYIQNPLKADPKFL